MERRAKRGGGGTSKLGNGEWKGSPTGEREEGRDGGGQEAGQGFGAHDRHRRGRPPARETVHICRRDGAGCQGTHPPWHCKAFGKIQAKEREKIIEDNQLCPFCLLHDRAKPCGAKQRSVNPSCHAPHCKGKHIQKLHELLKDVFKDENQVHSVHRDDEWEESEEAWEVGGDEEMMIVGTIQQEDDYNWQDASKSWLEQDEEEENGTYYVGTCQGAGSVLKGAKGGQSNMAALPPRKGATVRKPRKNAGVPPGRRIW